MDKLNIERLYDCLDENAMRLYEHDKTPYLDGVVQTCDAILYDTFDEKLDVELQNLIKKSISKIKKISFQKEEIRKTMQLCILKGLKHLKQSNEKMTPDTIGLLVSYFIQRFFSDKPLVLFDPLVGTGNLITCVANQIPQVCTLVGCDNDLSQYQLARSMFSMMEYSDQVYLQDTLTFENLSADVLLTDFSYQSPDEEPYFPYEVVLHHLNNVAENGLMVLLIYNDFFEAFKAGEFRKQLLETCHILGLIKLPDTLFSGISKSILLLQKRNPFEEAKPFLLADVPSFEDQEAFTRAIAQINQWFDNQNHEGDK